MELKEGTLITFKSSASGARWRGKVVERNKYGYRVLTEDTRVVLVFDHEIVSVRSQVDNREVW